MLRLVRHGHLADVPATWRYATGIALAGIAVVVRLLLIPLVGSAAPYLSLFPAVLLVALLLGKGVGVAASAIGALATEILLVPHQGGVIVSLADWGRIAIVVSSAVLLGEIGRRLREAEAALVDTDRRKDEFLAVLSHELRNPLGTIRSALSILDHEASPPGRADGARARTIIDRQLGHLSRLVDDLLDVSRIKTGKIRIERRSVDLRDLTRRTVEDHLSLLAANDLTIELRLPDDPVWVNGDPTRLAQVLGNLLQNASKFTPPGGRVQVSLVTESTNARLRVRDNGLGLDADVRSRLFQPFAQSDTTMHRTRGGLGIGLALVKALVELHNGQITASSEGPGKGCEFEVVLPLAEEREPAALPTEQAEGVEAHRKRVLIIEDNRDFAVMLQVLLQVMGGHEVYIADNGPRGIEIARRVYPDVVVCDIGLPVMDGYEVARALRAQPAARHAMLIALTGYASVDDARRAVEAGFNYHVPKGGDPEAVVRLLGTLPPPPV